MVLTTARSGRSVLSATALIVVVLAVATIVTVWAMQHAGYVPCELCLLERDPFYASLPIGAATFFLVRAGRMRLAAIGFALLTLAFAAGVVLGLYHTGVEWKMWAGPEGCTGPLTAPGKVDDFLKSLSAVKVVRCDAPALLVFGLSLASWNVLVSVVLLLLSGFGLRRALQTSGQHA